VALTTYAGLIAKIGDDLERGDVADLAPDWIALAEGRFNRELRTHQMLSRGTATLNTLDAGFGTQPTDFAAPMSMRLTSGSKRLLQYLTAEQMANFVSSATGGEVSAYASIGDEFWFWPEPTGDETVELIYYAKIPALSTSNSTNWLLAAFPDVYHRGAMLEAALYYRDDALAKNMQGLFEEALLAVEKSAQRDLLAANLNPTPSGFAV